ncbi:MAG: hypothetical protein ACXVVQ_07295 [Solirubrobacteraceae bacterium]
MTRKRPSTKSRRRRSLSRTVLSLAVAAVVAAGLPFTVMYVTALHKRPATVTAISAPGTTRSTTRVITTASGATRVIAVNGSPGAQAIVPTPVVTTDS